eukprot:gene6616-3269_t
MVGTTSIELEQRFILFHLAVQFVAGVALLVGSASRSYNLLLRRCSIKTPSSERLKAAAETMERASEAAAAASSQAHGDSDEEVDPSAVLRRKKRERAMKEAATDAAEQLAAEQYSDAYEANRLQSLDAWCNLRSQLLLTEPLTTCFGTDPTDALLAAFEDQGPVLSTRSSTELCLTSGFAHQIQGSCFLALISSLLTSLKFLMKESRTMEQSSAAAVVAVPMSVLLLWRPLSAAVVFSQVQHTAMPAGWMGDSRLLNLAIASWMFACLTIMLAFVMVSMMGLHLQARNAIVSHMCLVPESRSPFPRGGYPRAPRMLDVSGHRLPKHTPTEALPVDYPNTGPGHCPPRHTPTEALLVDYPNSVPAHRASKHTPTEALLMDYPNTGIGHRLSSFSLMPGLFSSPVKRRSSATTSATTSATHIEGYTTSAAAAAATAAGDKATISSSPKQSFLAHRLRRQPVGSAGPSTPRHTRADCGEGGTWSPSSLLKWGKSQLSALKDHSTPLASMSPLSGKAGYQRLVHDGVEMQGNRLAHVRVEMQGDRLAHVRLAHDRVEMQGDRLAHVRLAHDRVEMQGDRLAHDRVEMQGNRLAHDRVEMQGDRLAHVRVEMQGDRLAHVRLAHDRVEMQGDRLAHVRLAHDRVEMQDDRLAHDRVEMQGDRLAHDRAEMHGDRLAHDRVEMQGDRLAHDRVEMQGDRLAHDRAEMQGDRLAHDRVEMQGDRLAHDRVEMQGDRLAHDRAEMHGDRLAHDRVEMQGETWGKGGQAQMAPNIQIQTSRWVGPVPDGWVPIQTAGSRSGPTKIQTSRRLLEFVDGHDKPSGGVTSSQLYESGPELPEIPLIPDTHDRGQTQSTWMSGWDSAGPSPPDGMILRSSQGDSIGTQSPREYTQQAGSCIRGTAHCQGASDSYGCTSRGTAHCQGASDSYGCTSEITAQEEARPDSATWTAGSAGEHSGLLRALGRKKSKKRYRSRHAARMHSLVGGRVANKAVIAALDIPTLGRGNDDPPVEDLRIVQRLRGGGVGVHQSWNSEEVAYEDRAQDHLRAIWHKVYMIAVMLPIGLIAFALSVSTLAIAHEDLDLAGTWFYVDAAGAGLDLVVFMLITWGLFGTYAILLIALRQNNVNAISPLTSTAGV